MTEFLNKLAELGELTVFTLEDGYVCNFMELLSSCTRQCSANAVPRFPACHICTAKPSCIHVLHASLVDAAVFTMSTCSK